MSGNAAGAGRFFAGFGTAAAGLGAILVVAWALLWGLEALGGPDLRMPMQLLQSGGALIVIGVVLRWLVQARSGGSGAGTGDV